MWCPDFKHTFHHEQNISESASAIRWLQSQDTVEDIFNNYITLQEALAGSSSYTSQGILFARGWEEEILFIVMQPAPN